MGSFDPNRCDCDNDCPDLPHCICILIHDEHRCLCDCWGDDTTILVSATRPEMIEVDRKVSRDTIVDLVAKEATLAQVAARLARISSDEVLVPALDLDKPVALSLKGVTLDAAIQETGLVRRDRFDQPPPAHGADT